MRLRSIFPSLWQNETFAALSWDARFMLMGLWSYADDEGRGQDKVALIAAALFPFDLERDAAQTFQRTAAAVDEWPPPVSLADTRPAAPATSRSSTGMPGRSLNDQRRHAFPAQSSGALRSLPEDSP
jgi:hypothetical protein